MSKKIALIGGGGFAYEVIEVIEMLEYEVYGVFAQANSLKEYTHYGYLEELLEHKDKFDGVHIAFGGITKEQIQNRREIIAFLNQHNIPAISLVSPLARLAKSVEVGQGCYIAHFVYISQEAKLGNHVLINNRSDIGHHSVIADNVTISPKVFLGGSVKVGEDTLLGVGSTIKQGIEIGHSSIIAMGSTLIRRIKPYTLVLAPQSTIHKDFYKDE